MTALSRRDFARMLTISGTASFLPAHLIAGDRTDLAELGLSCAPLPPTPQRPDEKYWQEVRARFLLPRDLAFLNAANLCPTSIPVVEALEKNTRLLDANPSGTARAQLTQGREEARRLIAEALRVTPEEIVITRNTSEGNNLVSSGLQLGANDEVLVFADNHQSNLNAWRDKARRFGFAVVSVAQVSPHPGTMAYVDAFAKAITPRTKVLAFTHVTNTVGDMLPAAALCKLARERGVLSHMDGAQSFGVLDVNLADVRPDFYTGSVHKWPCGPKETGVLFINQAIQDRVWPSVVSLYGGAVGISRTFEANGQRDEAALAALAEAIKFQTAIGRATIEARGRELVKRLTEGLARLDGIKFWTQADATLSAAIVVFQPAALDVRRLVTALQGNEKIIVTARAGTDRPGVRVSPHFYNTADEIDRLVGAIAKYLKNGV